MEQKELIELLHLVGQSNLMEFHLKDGGFELYLNKNTMSRSQVSSSAPVAQVPVASAVGNEVATAVEIPAQAATQAPVAVEKAPVEEVGGKNIVSPLVGVAYLQPSPDKPNFKKVGDKVTKGEVVCIIEAMKVMNEITSDVTGEIVAVLIENEQVIEFNQPLFRVKEEA